jgi:hypothetical protein
MTGAGIKDTYPGIRAATVSLARQTLGNSGLLVPISFRGQSNTQPKPQLLQQDGRLE